MLNVTESLAISMGSAQTDANFSWDGHGWHLVAGAWALVLVAFFALILLAVSVFQRMKPLQRAVFRLRQRQAQAAALAEQLAAAQQVLAGRAAGS